MLKFSQIILNSINRNINRLPTVVRCNNFSSSFPTVELKNVQNNSTESYINDNVKESPPKPITDVKANSMVAAAFASLKLESSTQHIKTPFTDKRILKATNIDDLLSISEGNGVSRRHALKVVSVLADWSTSGKINLKDFEADPRFIRLCRILTKGGHIKNKSIVVPQSEDLSTILNVTADDEAAKLVGNITLPQMVKVMSTLAQKKRRSTLLLRALSYNITASSDRLNLKQCSDLLYSMAILNFPDENLLSRIGNDICVELESDVKKSAVIGSIITSIGLLKFKNSEVLDALSQWVFNNHALCRPQDIFSLFMTLAVLHYTPNNIEKIFENIIPQLTPSEASKPSVWLDIVWSLALLNQARTEHLSSVLSNDFINKLELDNPLSISSQLKLLNIDAIAKYLVPDYQGCRLSSASEIRDTKISYSKEKGDMVDAVVDSLRNLIQSENLIRTKINTGLGFLVDAECSLDKKCNPVPLSPTKLKDGIIRVALLVYDYHDMTRGRVEPTGINILASKLLEAQGYKVIIIPYTEFKPRDKLIHRVKYIESKLKEVVKC